MNLTGQDLAFIAKKRTATSLMKALAAALNKWAPHYGINDRKELAYLIANMVPETGGFRAIVENLNYSEAALLRVFKRYYNPAKYPGLAAKHARKPEVIANYVYADENRSARGKLGNIHPGDGWKFRGGGPGQITGRNNFQEFQDATGIPVIDQPELLHDPDTGIQAMCVFWVKNPRLGRTARQGKTTANRAAYNGGSHGLSMMKASLGRAHQVCRRLDLDGGRVVPGEPVHDPRLDKSEPAPVPPPADPEDKVLRFGSRGEDVRQVQTLLNEKGYRCGRADGIFGKLLRNAVLILKAENDLPDPGVASITLRQVRAAAAHEQVRAGMTMKDLRQDGSSQVKSADIGQRVTELGIGGAGLTTFLGGGDEPDGSVADKATDLLNKAEDAKVTLDRGTDLFGSVWSMVAPYKTLIIVVVVLAAVWFLMQRVKARRLEEARAGKNL